MKQGAVSTESPVNTLLRSIEQRLNERSELKLKYLRRVEEVAVELAGYRAREVELDAEIRDLEGALENRSTAARPALESVPLAPAANRAPSAKAPRARAAASATVKNPGGRPDTTGHPLPAAIGNISEFVREQNKLGKHHPEPEIRAWYERGHTLSEYTVRSWYGLGERCKRIPEVWANYFQKKHGISKKTAWPKGTRAD